MVQVHPGPPEHNPNLPLTALQTTYLMYFVSAFLFFLAIYFGISGFRSDDKEMKGMALGFLLAAVGTVLITIFALSAL